MPDEYDDLLDSLTPTPSRSARPRLPELISFAKENNLTVGSTTGGRHNAGSKHYSGNAIDIKGSGAFDDQTVQELSRKASERGFLLRDERRHPPGQKVWGGPHIHLEAADQQPQRDQYDTLLDEIQGQTPPPRLKTSEAATEPAQAPSVPVRDPFSGVRGGVRAQRPVSIGELRRTEDWPGRPSTVNQTSDELRVMKGEQPADRLAYQRQGELIERAGARRPTQVFETPTRSMQARRPGIVERATEAAKAYAPGLANLDTPMGIKTDPLRGAASLGLVDLSREVSPEELQIDPQAQAKANLAYQVGQIAPAVIPYVGAGKLAAAAIPGSTRAAGIGRTAATFGGVDLVRQGIQAVQTGKPVDLSEAGISTAMGAAMGGIAGVDPSMKRQIAAFLLPQVTVDVARGTPVEQAIPNALTALGFALTSGAEWKPTRKFNPEVVGGQRATETPVSEVRDLRPARPTEISDVVAEPPRETVAPQTRAEARQARVAEPPVVPPAVEAAERRQVRREFDKIKESASKQVEIPVQPAEVRKAEGVQQTPSTPSKVSDLETGLVEPARQAASSLPVESGEGAALEQLKSQIETSRDRAELNQTLDALSSVQKRIRGQLDATPFSDYKTHNRLNKESAKAYELSTLAHKTIGDLAEEGTRQNEQSAAATLNRIQTKPADIAKPVGSVTPKQITEGAESQELSQVESNLKSAGIEVRDNPNGHMVMPNGKGVAPVSGRGISNHWEVAVDAGYLPKSYLDHLPVSPNAIVNGLLKKGWLRFKGIGSYETWGLPKNHAEIIEDALTREAQHNPSKTAYIDDAESGTSYSFKLKDFADNDFNLRRTLKNAEKNSYKPTPALDLKLPVDETIVPQRGTKELSGGTIKPILGTKEPMRGTATPTEPTGGEGAVEALRNQILTSRNKQDLAAVINELEKVKKETWAEFTALPDGPAKEAAREKWAQITKLQTDAYETSGNLSYDRLHQLTDQWRGIANAFENPKAVDAKPVKNIVKQLAAAPTEPLVEPKSPTGREEVIQRPSKPAREEKPNVAQETLATIESEKQIPRSSKGEAEAAPDKPITTSATPSGIARVPVSELNLDPERFQFKSGHNQKGGTGSLSGVTKWDENLGGIVAVWRDPADGKTYVVNGHNRLEKAQELGVRNIDVKHIQAADAQEARAVGAKINIAEGQGTAIDAATFFRDSGATEATLKAQGIPLTKSVARDGLALSKLDDFIFQAVKRGDLAEEHGVAIGSKIESPDLQAQAYKAIAKASEKGRPLTKGVVDEMLDAIGAAPRHTQTEQSLFGDFETEKSLFNERAQVAAAIKRQLAGDKTLFGTAARKSGRLAEGGTKVDVEQAKQLQESATEALGVFDTLKNRTGGISDILDEGAKKVAAGQRPDAVARETYGKIKQAVSEAIRGSAGKVEQGSAGVSEPSKDQTRQRALGESEGARAKTETDLFSVPEPEPALVKSARERQEKRIAEKAAGIEYRRAGADPYELIDNLTIKGWDLYSQKIKPTFEEWSRKLREEFGPESESHLRKIWTQLGGPEPSTTAAKREKVTSDRAARGEESIARPERKSDQSLLTEAKAANAKDPTEPLRLIDQVLNGKKGALSDKETVQLDLHVQELKNKYDAVNKQLVEANDPATIKDLSETSDAMEREMRSAEEAFAASGTEKGRALRAQRVEIDQDFRLLTMISKATKARGRELTRDERATIKEQSEKIAELETKVAEATARAEKAEAERAVGKLKDETVRQNRRASRGLKKAGLDQEAAELRSLIAQAWKRQSAGGGEIHSAMGLAKLDPEGVVTKLVVKLARNRIEANIGLKAEALIDEVHGLLKDVVDLSRRDVSEMISGYGKTFEMSQDVVDTRLRELKSIIAANLGKADIIEKGIRPLRRGLQRDKPTQEVRAAMRELRDTLREHGMQVERSKGSPEEQQQSALDAAKTRTRNRIEDLTKWIADGKRTVANKTEIIPDAELTTLKSEKDRLQKIFEGIDDPAADQKKIDNAIKTAEKSIADLEAKIKAGALAPKPRVTGPTSPALEAARAEQKALRGILNDLRNAAKVKPSDVEIEARKLLSANKSMTSRMEKQIADLERRMKQGDFSEKAKRSPVPYSRENLALQKQLEQIKHEYAKANYKATRSRFGQITDELAKAANVPKTLKSMGDISAVFRQGGYYAITHPIEGLAKPSAAMLRSFTETGYRNVEQLIQNHPKFDQAKRDGVEFTGVDKNDPHLSHKEEGYFGGETVDVLASGKYNPLKVVSGVKNFSERTFISFLDSQRMQMYDVMTEGLKAQGLTPRNAPESYKGVAKLINIGTGRGNLGKRGNQAAPFLNILMFSPRLVVSRAQMLNNMFNPVAMARKSPGVRAQNIKDNVKFLAATTAFMGLATAAGGTVNRDPDDADFLKIRFGKTTYDTLTGLQQPFRYIINMTRAITGGETYPGQSIPDLTTRFARSKASPLAGLVIDAGTGEDFQGRKFSAKRAATDVITPLPVKDFAEAMQKEGLIKGFIKATPALTGIGVQTYDERPGKPVTHAEKLARKFLRQGMPDTAREDEQIEKDDKKAELRDRSRKGEDVKAELDKLDLTDRQRKTILEAKGQTRLQEDFKRLGIKEALTVYGVMTRGEREQVRDILAKKAESVENLTEGEQQVMRNKLKDIGLVVPPSRPKRPQRPSRSSRGQRGGAQWVTP